MYQLSPKVNPNTIFIIKFSDLEGRLEPEYYKPTIMELEGKVRAKSVKKLRDFIIKITSGATPSITEEEKYYSDEFNGIPFLRVQNLQTNGRLDLTETKFINQDTHHNYLKRSQVVGGNLLVKITGVGRMAIASVAPAGFIGNTNQHMVVIKTNERKTSEYLARYLNLDLIERLASRRATGATRPALDYPALKSIPIIENIDFSTIDEAEIKRQEKEAEAKALLDTISTYLLEELGIKSASKDNGLKNRVFTVNWSELKNRVDPIFYHSDLTVFNSGYYESVKLHSLVSSFKSGIGVGRQDQATAEKGIIQIRPTNIKEYGVLNFDKNVYIPIETIGDSELLKIDDVLFNNTNSQELVGKTAIVKTPIKLSFSNHITRIRVLENLLSPDYLCLILNSYQQNKIFYSICTNWNNQSGVGLELLSSLMIPCPPITKQIEIANQIKGIQSKAIELQAQAKAIVENAKKAIEQIILS